LGRAEALRGAMLAMIDGTLRRLKKIRRPILGVVAARFGDVLLGG
jgi:hypothetical protein